MSGKPGGDDVGAEPVEIVESPDMGIVLSDGCRLSARVWMPKDAEMRPVPAILEYIPYRKRDGTLPRDELMHPWFAAHGYAAVRVDMRGNGDSDGLMADEYTAQELDDACEVIAWLAAQAWCSGTVGMMGKSWGGFNCLQTAALRPPTLKAVISVCSTTDRFADDIHFKGGCLLGENFGWGAVMLSYSSRPPDPVLRNDWRDEWLRRLEAEPFLAPRWAAEQARGAYWRHGSVGEDYSAIRAAVLSVGGWADNYMNTVAHLVENVKAPVKGIVGPWVHQYPHTAVPGPQIGFLQEALRWWDRWLKDQPNGAENDPAYRAYMIHSEPPDASAAHRKGHWVADESWPSDRSRQEVWALSPGGHLGGRHEALHDPVATPQHLGMRAGEFFPMGLNAEMPGDQAGDDAISLTYDSAPLEGGLDLMGAPVLRLRLTSDRPRAMLVARLCDVAPEGAAVRICHGMLNLCHRDSREHPSHLVPGEEIAAELVLDQCAYRLAPGHRLRIALSNSYWPFVWPSPEPVRLTLRAGALHLPVHEGSAGDEWTFPAPEMAPAWRHKVHAPGRARRRIEEDLLTGRMSLIVEDEGVECENLDHGLVTRETMREVWSIHPDDPASAEAQIRWTQHLSRCAWRVETEAQARMWCDAEKLHFDAILTAHEGGKEVLRRQWQDSVERAFV
jgi:putative CocE/NonD family hydrolase